MFVKSAITVLIALFLSSPVLARDPMLELLEGQPPVPKGVEKEKVVEGCPEGWECALVASFVKGGYKAEAKRFPVGHLTADKSWSRIAVVQQIGEQHGVIVNTVKVRQGGQWTPYVQGARLAEGRTEFAVPVPAGTPEIVFSFDHGRGAKVTVSLERPLQ